jgi:hypothetical protein
VSEGAAPRVVSASRRSDVPAFHADWLTERIRIGFTDVANPFNGRITRVSLDILSAQRPGFSRGGPMIGRAAAGCKPC